MKELRSLDSLTALLAVQRSGSPTKAAHRLGRAPSSIYRAIARLEADVGVPLFQRKASGWIPTETGREIVQLGERIEAEIDTTELALLRRNRRSPASLRVSASDSFATYLGPVLAAFVNSRADVHIELAVDNALVDLLRREADIAVRPDKRPGEGIVGQRACKLAHALYGADRLLARHGPPTTASELSRYPICALTSALPHFTGSNWWKLLAAPEPSFVTNTETALAAAIAAGVGLGVLPCFVGDGLASVSRVAGLQVGEPVDIWLVTHPALRTNEVVKALLRTMAGAIRKDAHRFAGSGP